jgi:hypothetical protein
MPKVTRRGQAKTAGRHYLLFGEYRRAVPADSNEGKTSFLSMTAGPYPGVFLPREEALLFLYEAVVPLDNKVIKGSMCVTGILPISKEEEDVWMSSTGVLRQRGLDTETQGAWSVSETPVKEGARR